MNNLDIFGPALIARLSSAVCYLVARRDFPPRDAVLVVIGVLIVEDVEAAVLALDAVKRALDGKPPPHLA